MEENTYMSHLEQLNEVSPKMRVVIYEIMASKPISLSRLAAEMDINPITLKRFMNGGRMKNYSLMRIAHYIKTRCS